MKKINMVFLFFALPFFAQDIISEEVVITNEAITLPGTLSYPKVQEKLPLIIFIHGSGNIDRDGNQAGINVKANYIKILSDSLNQNGIAFFRYDKRTARPENMNSVLKDNSYEYLVEDAKKVIAYFKEDSRFHQMVVIGHSQGALTAMLAINDAVDKYISLAGLSESMDKALIRQITAQNKDLGAKAAAHFEALEKTDTIQEVHPFLKVIFTPINHKFIQSYSAYNPVEVIKKLNVPTLIINGDADLQVRVEDAKALHRAKPDAQLTIIPGMNHVLKQVSTTQENQQSYYDEKFPISGALLKAIIGFIKH